MSKFAYLLLSAALLLLGGALAQSQQPNSELVMNLVDPIGAENFVYQTKSMLYAQIVSPTPLMIEVLNTLTKKGIGVYLLCDLTSRNVCNQVNGAKTAYASVYSPAVYIDEEWILVSKFLDRGIESNTSFAVKSPYLARFMSDFISGYFQ